MRRRQPFPKYDWFITFKSEVHANFFQNERQPLKDHLNVVNVVEGGVMLAVFTKKIKNKVYFNICGASMPEVKKKLN